MGRLADKNILITGGNSGIGLAAAQEFDREGARVAICGLNEGTLQATKETLGAGSLAVRADVSNLSDLDTMFATIKREFGHLDGVFVNAGYSEFLPFEDVTEQSFDKVIDVNFKGVYFTIQKALPLLRQGSFRRFRSFGCDPRRWRRSPPGSARLPFSIFSPADPSYRVKHGQADRMKDRAASTSGSAITGQCWLELEPPKEMR